MTERSTRVPPADPVLGEWRARVRETMEALCAERPPADHHEALREEFEATLQRAIEIALRRARARK